MSYWNRFTAILALSILFTAPALADGTKGKTINRGPAPLEAHALTPPRPGCRLTEDGQHWACPAPVRKITHAHAPKRHTTRTVHRKPAKTVRRVVKTSAPTVSTLTLDISGFNGGVGSGVGGGHYGGGGAIILGSGKRFSGVTQHAASHMTFRKSYSGGKRGGGCGC